MIRHHLIYLNRLKKFTQFDEKKVSLKQFRAHLLHQLQNRILLRRPYIYPQKLQSNSTASMNKKSGHKIFLERSVGERHLKTVLNQQTYRVHSIVQKTVRIKLEPNYLLS